jgi:hypothetical protein
MRLMTPMREADSLSARLLPGPYLYRKTPLIYYGLLLTKTVGQSPLRFLSKVLINAQTSKSWEPSYRFIRS